MSLLWENDDKPVDFIRDSNWQKLEVVKIRQVIQDFTVELQLSWSWLVGG